MRISQRLANLNWVALILFPLTVVLMEVFWLYPWLVWVGRLPVSVWWRPPLSLLSLTLLLGVSFFVSRFFLARKGQLHWIRLGIVSCGLVAIFIVLRIEYSAGFGLLSRHWFIYLAQALLGSFSYPHPIVMALAVAAYLWWRGIGLGRSTIYFDDIYRSFLIGLVALVLLIILWAGSLGSLQSLALLGFQVAGFFFFSLTVMALANLQTMRQKMLPEGVTQALNRRWLSISLAVVGGIVLASIGIAGALSAEFANLVARALSLTSDLLFKALVYLLLPLGYLVEGLSYIVGFILSWFRRGQPLQPFRMPELLSDLAELPEQATRKGLSAEVILALKWLFFALVTAVIVFLLVRAIFRYLSFGEKVEVEEIHESLWSWAGFKADLRLFFSLLRRRFERQGKKPAAPFVPDWYEDDFPGILSIRQIYQCLLWEAAHFKIVRWCHETPYEYVRRLEEAVPDGGKPLNELTALYVDVRYGDLEADDKQVIYANELWKRLRRLFSPPEGNQPIE